MDSRGTQGVSEMGDGMNAEISRKVAEFVTDSQSRMLGDLDRLITARMDSMEQKISDNQKSLSEGQLAKISTLKDIKFKRKSCEEQFKFNAGLECNLRDIDQSLSSPTVANLSKAAENVSEGLQSLQHRQKMIRLADTSEMGWKVVGEYESNPLASDSDDEKKINRAEARADRRSRRDRPRRSRGRYGPYRGRLSSATYSAPAVQQGQQPAQTQMSGQKPGACFACGGLGHWKNECGMNRRAQASNNKLSTNCVCNLLNETCQSDCRSNEDHMPTDYRSGGKLLVDSTDRQSGEGQTNRVQSTDEQVVTPVGRLKANKPQWANIGVNPYILEIIEEGYKIPFIDIPMENNMKNNKSARDNPVFVAKEIQVLIKKGIVKETTEKPIVVNPLTVAYGKTGKHRLVLDCRHINPCLAKFRFKYEDVSVARQMFNRHDFMFSFDLSGAYHHIMVYEHHRMYLGFAWLEGENNRYFVFNCLPFGLATAGYIFSKLLKSVVKYWRSGGHRVVMFLDDGLGGSDNEVRALECSEHVRNSLLELGFLIAEEKCVWAPTRIATWLGYVWDMHSGRLFVTDERIRRVEMCSETLLRQINTDQLPLIAVRVLASVVGQIISLQTVMGHLVRLKTRGMYRCILARASWNAPVCVSDEALSELRFWKDNVRTLSKEGCCLRPAFQEEVQVFTDASGTGYGGFVVNCQNHCVWDCVSDAHKETGVYDDDNAGYVMSDVKMALAQDAQDFLESEIQCPSNVDVSLESGGQGKVEAGKPIEWENSPRDGRIDTLETGHVLESHNMCNTGIGAYMCTSCDNGTEVIGSWDKVEQAQSSTWRELEAARRVLNSHVDTLYGIGLTGSIRGELRTVGSEGLGSDMANRISTYMMNSKSDNTVKKYYASFTKWRRYCDNHSYRAIPAEPMHVVLYLTSLLDGEASIHTITTVIYAIKWAHGLNNFIDPTDNGFVKNMHEAAKRLRSKNVVKKDVVTSEMLVDLCERHRGDSDVITLRDLSMILIGYAGFLRYDELSDLGTGDVTFESNFLKIIIKKSKTDKYRVGNEVVIAKGHTVACPYSMLERYMSVAGLTAVSDCFLFRPAYRSRGVCKLLEKNKKLSYTRAREVILSKLKSVSPDSNFGLHSLRSGGVTMAANAGVSDRCLKRHGRWRSDLSKDGYVMDNMSKRLKITESLEL